MDLKHNHTFVTNMDPVQTCCGSQAVVLNGERGLQDHSAGFFFLVLKPFPIFTFLRPVQIAKDAVTKPA